MADGPERQASGFTLELNATEQRIIDAARICFEAAGVTDTRIRDIASHAGVSRQTVYKHFSGKEDIVDRIAFLEMAKVNKILRARIQRDLPFPEKLTDAIVLSIEVSRENSYLRRVIEDAQLMPRYPTKDVSLYLWQRAQWSRMLENAQHAGELAPDLDADQVVHWILFSQLGLLTAEDRSVLIDTDMHSFVRRFIVEPLLNPNKGSQSTANDFVLNRVVEEQFVKVAHPEEEHGIFMPRLDRQVLRYERAWRRSGFRGSRSVGHGPGRYRQCRRFAKPRTSLRATKLSYRTEWPVLRLAWLSHRPSLPPQLKLFAKTDLPRDDH